MGTFAAPVGYALQGLGAIQGGYAQQAGYEYQAEQKQNEKLSARMQASQTDTNLLAELDQVQDTVDVIRAQNGVEALSPTGLAYKQEQSEVAAMERMRRRRQFGYVEDQAKSDINAYQYAGYAAVTQGWLGGLAAFAKGYQSLQTAMTPTPVPGA